MKWIRRNKTKQNADDAQLLAEYYQTGDLEILGQLYERYMPLLYGLCLKYYQDEERGKDAVMQIFELLIDKLKQHRVSNFKSWLYTLAKNYCLMDLRALGKHEFSNLEDNYVENAADLHLDIESDKEEKFRELEACLRKLPQEQNEALRLFYFEKKCYREIAELTGYEINKVKSYIQNGKRNLKICIEKSREYN